MNAKMARVVRNEALKYRWIKPEIGHFAIKNPNQLTIYALHPDTLEPFVFHSRDEFDIHNTKIKPQYIVGIKPRWVGKIKRHGRYPCRP